MLIIQISKKQMAQMHITRAVTALKALAAGPAERHRNFERAAWHRAQAATWLN